MKFRTTRKAIKENYGTIIKVSYCGLQNLLTHLEPTSYVTRAEGWAADIYELAPDVALVTGYAPFGNVIAYYDICRRYNNEALTIIRTIDDYEEQKKQLDRLINEFLEEVLK